MKPRVSVIIPLYNGSETIKRAVDSVLSQSMTDKLELIIIDDGSSDNSLEVVNKVKKISDKNIKIFKNKKNIGISKTQNKGLEAASGDFIARLDQDDCWIDTDKLKKQVKLLEENDNIGLVGTWTKVINHNGPDFVLEPPLNDEQIRQKMLMADMFAAPSVMFRKSLVDEIGLYREDLKHGTEDYEYWLRIGAKARFAIIGEHMLEYHFHANSYSVKNKVKAIKEHLQIIEAYKDSYPNYKGARRKNLFQYSLLKIKPLQRVYGLIAPRLANRIYS